MFLRDKADDGVSDVGLLKSWYCFPEVKQNWFGFSVTGNNGRGLGLDFANSLHANLNKIFGDFGSENITNGSHLEKVCLISDKVGRDNISDFTTNLIKEFLCDYTHTFAEKFLKADQKRKVWVNKVTFDYEAEAWMRKEYILPWVNSDYILLTPKDLLTRDENWINKDDLVNGFEEIPMAISDETLRAQVFNYFNNILFSNIKKDKEPSKAQRREATLRTIRQFPNLIDFYIKYKEMNGEKAVDISSAKVQATEKMFILHIKDFQNQLLKNSKFYYTDFTTYEETHERLAYLKDIIENKGAHNLFYQKGEPTIQTEKDVQILFRLVWYGTPSDVGTEANDGRGPVDFKISKGARDKTLVEFKLAKNPQLERNLIKQLPVYLSASDAKNGIKAIIFFTIKEEERVKGILDKLGILDHKDIILIDARADNKPSGSKA